jgi:hypothetical protein
MPHLWPWAIEFVEEEEDARKGSGSLYFGTKFKMAMVADRAEVVAVRVDKERGVLLTLTRTTDGRIAEVPAAWVEIEPRPVGAQVAEVEMHHEKERAFCDRRKAEATATLLHYIRTLGAACDVPMDGDTEAEVAFIVDAIVDASVAASHVDSTEKLRKIMTQARSK